MISPFGKIHIPRIWFVSHQHGMFSDLLIRTSTVKPVCRGEIIKCFFSGFGEIWNSKVSVCSFHLANGSMGRQCFSEVLVVSCFMITSRVGEVFVSRRWGRGNENQIWGINVFALVENGGIYMYTVYMEQVHCSDLLPIPFPFCANPSISWVIVTLSRQSFFSPVCKCTIKELVVRDHRIWTRAKSGQLFTRRPQILNWSPLLQPCPHYHATTLGDDTDRKGKQVICMPDNVLPGLVPFKSCTLPEVKPCWDGWRQASRLRYI